MDHLTDQAENTDFPECPYFAAGLYGLGINPLIHYEPFEGFKEWLYFALMYEIWGVWPKLQDFFPQAYPFVVTSARLNYYYAEASRLLVQMPSDEAQIAFLDRTRPALIQARQEMERAWRRMDPRLALSILLLIDTLNSWRSRQYERLGHDVFKDVVPLNHEIAQSLLRWDA